MASAPSASWNSRCITHLANCPNRSLPTNSSDEPKEWRLEGRSQSNHEKIVWLPHLPHPGTRAVSLTWQTARTGAYPRILLTSLKYGGWRALGARAQRSEEHTSELQSLRHIVC